MDRLIEAIDNTQNPSVVGLDPTEALVPPQVVVSFADEVRDSVESPEEVESAQLAVAYFEYNRTAYPAKQEEGMSCGQICHAKLLLFRY